ncbi:MAG: protein kinase [Anaerolineae bacterium]|nr:protein kinase [Anaerolineae bacterium]
MPALIGKQIDRYQIVAQLGEGGMATVYKAFDTRLERHVALKVITTQQQTSEQFLKRFEREAKALAKLSHPNIVHVHDYGEQDGQPYLVMEFIDGGTLKNRMGSPIAYQEAARLLIPIAKALGYAHKQDIVHRDVKPANILLQRNGEPMLSDFGIAKVLETDQPQLTQMGVGIGTPEYMAPEQGQGGAIDRRADIYSLGLVLYELVTGRKPFTADTPMAVVWKQVTEPLPDPRQYVPSLPPFVSTVLQKALQKRPADRYQTMEELVHVLEQIATLPVPGTMQQPVNYPAQTPPTQAESAVFTPPTYTQPPQQQPRYTQQPPPIVPLNQTGQPYPAQPPGDAFRSAQIPASPPSVPAKKGMSKGCIVALVAGILLLLLVVCGVFLVVFDLLPDAINPFTTSTPTATRTLIPTNTKRPTATDQPTLEPTWTDLPSQTPEALSPTEASSDPLQACADSFAISAFSSLPPIYCDQFTTNTGWFMDPTDNEYKYHTRYFVNDTLRWDMTSKRSVMTYEQFPLRQSVGHFAAQVSIKRITGPTNSDAGLLFRMDYDNDKYYFLTISDANQSYAFYRKDGDTWYTLKEWTYNSNIIPDDWNSIGVYGYEDWFDVYFNGVYIETLQDNTLSFGEMGIGIELYDADQFVTFAFDNFVLYEP